MCSSDLDSYHEVDCAGMPLYICDCVNDFDFLFSLNKILFGVGFLALTIAVAAGLLYAEKLISPIKETVGFTKKIARGNYNIFFKSKSDASEIQELQAAVSAMAKSLDEQEKREKKLTRDVAHELRTPLANISSYLEAMAEGALEASETIHVYANLRKRAFWAKRQPKWWR